MTSPASGADPVPLTAFEGEMTIYTASDLKARLEVAKRRGGDIEIDLSRVHEIDTAGLQLMLMAKRIDGATVRFVNHSPAVLRLLELSNATRDLGDPLVISADA